jgi:hypothetical protein
MLRYALVLEIRLPPHSKFKREHLSPGRLIASCSVFGTGGNSPEMGTVAIPSLGSAKTRIVISQDLNTSLGRSFFGSARIAAALQLPGTVQTVHLLS